ncbi:hypothetical protein [Microbacterium sp. 8M]|nr:hypothetical protein [Microbacterium sp. 8M]
MAVRRRWQLAQTTSHLAISSAIVDQERVDAVIARAISKVFVNWGR